MRIALAAAALLGVTGLARATFILPPEAPLERLLANTEKRLEKNPRDPHAHYVVARLHAMGYAFPGDGPRTIRATPNKDDGGVDWFFAADSIRVRLEGKFDEERRRHLHAAVRHYRLAAELADATKGDQRGVAGLSRLGRAWILENASRFVLEAGDPEGAEPPDTLDEQARAALDAAIRRLGAEEAEPRQAAREAIRSAGEKAYPRLLAHRAHEEPSVRAAVGDLLRERWMEAALADYRAASALTLDDTLRQEWRDQMATDQVAIEAGDAIVRLLQSRPAPTKAEREEIERLEKAKAEIGKKPRGPVTPVLFPVDRAAPLASLLPAGRSAVFDLDGDLVPERWPWPSAEAGILVWAPDPGKPVASGRQMIGGRTWWVFWRDGYEPLAALDDDGDGRLEGRELDGLAVWRDADGDAVSDAGEVETAAALGIAWIAARADSLEDGVPANARGVGFRDGSTRPTYDWTPSPLPAAVDP